MISKLKELLKKKAKKKIDLHKLLNDLENRIDLANSLGKEKSPNPE